MYSIDFFQSKKKNVDYWVVRAFNISQCVGQFCTRIFCCTGLDSSSFTDCKLQTVLNKYNT